MSLSVLILTGLSGSGKSTALHALEDIGYFCVDNLPVGLGEALLDNLRANGVCRRVALAMDMRDRDFLRHAPSFIEKLRGGAEPVRIVYLEAREETLLKRYSETRRRHPLDDGEGLRASIAREHELMVPLRELADDTIDTSAMSPHVLRAQLEKQIGGDDDSATPSVALVSFGFKHGLPLDADMVFDVRFLPNPYFDAGLRAKTGLDEEVREYVLTSHDGREFVERVDGILDYLFPLFRREGKRYVTIAIGCTGGQHRSVSVAYSLAERMRAKAVEVDLRHRDLPRGVS